MAPETQSLQRVQRLQILQRLSPLQRLQRTQTLERLQRLQRVPWQTIIPKRSKTRNNQNKLRAKSRSPALFGRKFFGHTERRPFGATVWGRVCVRVRVPFPTWDIHFPTFLPSLKRTVEEQKDGNRNVGLSLSLSAINANLYVYVCMFVYTKLCLDWRPGPTS